MTNETESDPDPLRELGMAFCVGYVGYAIVDAVEVLQAGINDRLRMIIKLMPYMSGMYFTDKQRRKAESELFRLQTEITDLVDELHNTLVMAPELGRPVTVTHT